MTVTWTIFRREFASFFVTPTAYIIAAGFMLFTGVFFSQEFQVAAVRRIPINPATIPSLVSYMLVFFAPLFTMRLFAEEKREGTVELLLTAPVSEASIVVAKFMAAWAYVTLLLGITLVYQGILATYAPQDIGHTILAYIGIWLYCGTVLSIGMMFSALTENQIVSAFSSLLTLLILYVGDGVGGIIGNIQLSEIMRSLSLEAHYSTSFAAGLFRAEDAAFYAGVIVIMLFMTMRILESNRWR